MDALKKTIENLTRRLQSRFPINRVNDHGAEYINTFNSTVVFLPFSTESEVHKSNANLFNRLEDVASAINSGLLDVQLLNFMYGGMINSIYRDHSEWVAWVKRCLGLRIYDQCDTLLGKLLHLSSARYSLKKPTFLFRLLFQGRAGRLFLWDIMRPNSIYSGRNLLTKNAFANELFKRDIFDEVDYFAEAAFIGESRIEIKPVQGILKSKRNTRKIFKLFTDCWINSKGVWPVGLQNFEDNNRLNEDNLKSWFEHVSSYWKVVFFAKFDVWSKTELAGMIAITYGNNLKRNENRWSLEITEAVKTSIGGNEKFVKDYIQSVGIPLKVEKGERVINFDKMALIQSFYTHSNMRKNYGFENTGRKLFRECVSYARNQLGLIPFLTVIADDEFTQKAVELYVGEGGAYLGTVRDAGRADQHLMHVFVF